MKDRFIVRREGDTTCKDGAIEFFINDNGKLAIVDVRGFEILLVVSCIDDPKPMDFDNIETDNKLSTKEDNTQSKGREST